MFYNNEIRAAADVSAPNKAEVKEQESKLAMQLIESLAAPFDASEYHDAYQAELEKLIEAKAHGKKLTVAPRSKKAPVVDLMSALQQSLKGKPAAGAGQKTLLRAVPKSVEKEKKGRKAS
jgi:DNA end-binding protein Ku